MSEQNNLYILLSIILLLFFTYFFLRFCIRELKQLITPPAIAKVQQLSPLPFAGLTELELLEFGGYREDGRLLLSFKGAIYDVSQDFREFGPEGLLCAAAGREFMEYLKGTLAPAEADIDNLVQRWGQLFESKYERVGVLVDENGAELFDAAGVRLQPSRAKPGLFDVELLPDLPAAN
ncbi:uncharacterized protein LOC108607583 isoform X2 [Drosophila busckii]|uniref:uncharacterized protein LOC108607583 isoform X2 n=1 Tax=Drosophila busckii TaxID=30019 RepID=UPI00083ECC56|nr:uncharacterized protein LOC108607583 isoform X2 [Drosophila busckii]